MWTLVPGGPDWMPITPKTGSLFHADSQNFAENRSARRDEALIPRCRLSRNMTRISTIVGFIARIRFGGRNRPGAGME